MRRWHFIALIWLAASPALSQSSGDPSPSGPASEKWFKGNLHSHSLWSDGNDYPEVVAGWYRDSGYNFLALSDHNILSEGQKWVDADLAEKRGAIDSLKRYRERFGEDWVETRTRDGKLQVRLKPLAEFRPLLEQSGRFLMIQGEEITDHSENLPIHVNASNLRDVIKPQGGKSVREAIANNLTAIERQAARTGRPILGHLNHPNLGYAVTAEDLAAVAQVRFFEIYNAGTAESHLGDAKHPGTERLWDIANTLRITRFKTSPVFGLATDDSHQYSPGRGSAPGRGWIMVRAKRLTPETLMAALEKGDFYGTSGVTLEDVRYSPTTGVYQIEIRPDADARYTTQFIGTLRDPDSAGKASVTEKQQEGGSASSSPATVGRVLASQDGITPSYKLTGNELYVRAVITSSKKPVNFSAPHQQAWTQPVGWQKWLPAEAH